MNKLIALAVCACLLGCNSATQKNQNTVSKHSAPTLFIQAMDASVSTDNDITSYRDTGIARSIYYTIAYKGGGVIKIVYVLENSLNQEVITIPVEPFDTTDLKAITNTYIKGKKKRENEVTKTRFYEQAEENIQKYVSAISKPRDQQYSDVYSALSIASNICKQKNYQTYQRIIATFSDLKHCPKDKRNIKMPALQFDEATILCVRPGISTEQLKQMFSQQVETLSSSKDILSFL